MTTPRQITSSQNTIIKQLVALREAHNRKREGLILIDGQRNIARALQARLDVQAVFTSVGSENQNPSADEEFIQNHLLASDIDWVQLTPDLLKKVSYGQSNHPVAVARTPESHKEHLESICQQQTVTLLVLDRVEKPGNVGAAIRTCDAIGVDALILCDPICELWNPNAIRSSAGAIFSLPTFIYSMTELDSLFSRNHVCVYTTRLENATDYLKADFARKSAMVFGSEAHGLGNRWSNHPAVCIPMHGTGDSLNVSISAAIILAELQRQRWKSKDSR